MAAGPGRREVGTASYKNLVAQQWQQYETYVNISFVIQIHKPKRNCSQLFQLTPAARRPPPLALAANPPCDATLLTSFARKNR